MRLQTESIHTTHMLQTASDLTCLQAASIHTIHDVHPKKETPGAVGAKKVCMCAARAPNV